METARAKWLRENRKKVRAYKTKWRLNNPEKMQQCRANWELNNPGKKKEASKKWEQNNPEKTRTKWQNRRAKLLGAGGAYTVNDVKQLLVNQLNKCANIFCRKELVSYHIDHKIPLKLGGNNYSSNLQLLCPHCNCSKSAKHPLQWELEQFDKLVDDLNNKLIRKRNLNWLLFQGQLAAA
jgi:5-methylcytosine-specific restriction endonuclease McrA